jgi:hypothetical protein
LKRGDANESIRTLAELWWRAVYRGWGRGAGLSSSAGASASNSIEEVRRGVPLRRCASG